MKNILPCYYHINPLSLILFVFRKCDNCQKLFASDQGLKNHITRQSGKPCGLVDARAKRKKNKFFYAQVKSKLKMHKFRDLGSYKNMSDKKKRPKGKVFLTSEKEAILRNFDFFHSDKGEKISKVSIMLKAFHIMSFEA